MDKILHSHVFTDMNPCLFMVYTLFISVIILSLLMYIHCLFLFYFRDCSIPLHALLQNEAVRRARGAVLPRPRSGRDPGLQREGASQEGRGSHHRCPHRRRRHTRVQRWRPVVHVAAAFWTKGRRRQLLAGRLGALRQWQLPGQQRAKGLRHQGDHGVVQVVLHVEGPLQDPDLLRLIRLLPCPAPSGSSPRVCWS